MNFSKILRNGLLVLLATISITSCKNETVHEPLAEHLALENAEKQLTDNLKMYESIWLDVINKREIDRINETSFDAEVVLVSSPENIVGIQAVKDFYQNYLTGFSDMTITYLDVFGQGNKIVKHWRFEGTHTGSFFGIPASGKMVNITGVTLVEMKDGKIAKEENFLDNLAFYQQLGILPTE